MKRFIIPAMIIGLLGLSACTPEQIADAIKLDADRRAAETQPAPTVDTTPVAPESAAQPQATFVSPAPGASGCSAEPSNHGYRLDPTKFTNATARCTTLGPGEWVVAQVHCHNGQSLISPRQFNAGVDTSSSWDGCLRRLNTYADSADFVTGVGDF